MQELEESTDLYELWTIILFAVCLIGLVLIVIFVSPAALVFILIVLAIPSALLGAILGLIIPVFSRKRAKSDVFRRGRRGALIGMTAALTTAAASLVILHLLVLISEADEIS